MRSKWCKYVLSSAMAFCGIYANGMLHSAFAQETAQPKAIAEGETEVLKWQLKQMEEAVKRQQEQIQAIKNSLDTRIEEVKKSGISTLKPEDFRVYWKEGLRFESQDKNFKLKIGGRFYNDWWWSTEDKTIEDDLYKGKSETGTDFRTARLYVQGTIYNNVDFKIQYDFASTVNKFKDVYVELKEIPVVGAFRAGQFKEPFSLEELTSSTNITFMERGLTNRFAPSRHTGLMLHDAELDGRMTWAAGIFRPTDDLGNSTADIEPGNYSLTGRLTGLPWYEDNGKKLMHVGVGYSRQKYQNDAKAFDAKPEINMAQKFIDTKTISNVDYANLVGPELALVYGPFSFQTEYTLANLQRTNDTDAPDADFSGFYVFGSYFLTGDHRPYNKEEGCFSSVKPIKNFKWGEGIGAVELAARYSYLDLNDSDASSSATGRLKDATVGVNWYLNPNTRVMLDYVHARAFPDTKGNDGDADMFAMRFQVAF